MAKYVDSFEQPNANIKSKIGTVSVEPGDSLTDEVIQDKVGAMVTGSTQTGITVTYQDSTADIDFELDDEYLCDTVGAMFSSNTETGITVTYQDADNTIDLALSDEYIQDTVGAMFTSNTETGITVDYQDSDGTIDVVLINPALTNAGVANTGSTAVESGEAIHHKTTLTVSSTLPAIAGGANLSVGKLLYTFPAGAIIVHSAYMSMAITQSEGNINADTPDIGLGTVIAAGANALLSDTSGAENILTGQTANNCTGTAEVKTVADQVLVIESGDAHTVYFNAADGWAASGDAAAEISGTVVLNWSFIN